MRLPVLRVVCLSIVLCPSLAWAEERFFQPVVPARPTQVMVAGGMRNIAPVNSAAAIKACIEDYCEWATIEVRLTKDGKHVVFDADTVEAKSDGQGKVADMTLAQLEQLDIGAWFAARFAGTRVMTLVDALNLAKEKINLCLVCRQVDAQLLVQELESTNMGRQVLIQGEESVTKRIQVLTKGSVAVIAGDDDKVDWGSLAADAKPAVVDVAADKVTAKLCEKLHAAGIQLRANILGQGIDHADTWRKVIDAGVDFVLTDHPAGVLFAEARLRLGTFPVLVACHRGANRYAPENTLPAIQIAAELGADFAEIDIRTTNDGKQVLIHDGKVDRTTEKKGQVGSFSFAELTSFSAGNWFGKPFRDARIPSFDEGLSVYGPKMGAYLDAKDVAPEILLAAIKKHGLMERHTVYQSIEYCSRLKKLDSNVRVMPPLKRLEDAQAAAAIGAYAVDANWGSLSKELIATCHQHKIKVFSDALWRWESVDEYRKAIDWNIDCIQTDHPLRVLRAIELTMHDRKR